MSRRRGGARLAACVAFAAGAAAFARPARACGVGAAGGPAGVCDASAAIDAKRIAAADRIGASYGFTHSILFFSGDLRAETERHVVVASWEHRLGPRWTLQVGAGALVGGGLYTPTGTSPFLPGVIGSVSLSDRVFQGRGWAAPFLLTTFTLSAVYATTSKSGDAQATSYFASDFRFGAVLGTTLGGVLTPYLAARVFGGPVLWTYLGESVLGTDAYKYEIGPGLALALFGGRVALDVDTSALGEKDLRAGLSVAF